jgi:hypothetical protein
VLVFVTFANNITVFKVHDLYGGDIPKFISMHAHLPHLLLPTQMLLLSPSHQYYQEVGLTKSLYQG